MQPWSAPVEGCSAASNLAGMVLNGGGGGQDGNIAGMLNGGGGLVASWAMVTEKVEEREDIVFF